jgi:hypothetical protein
MVAVHGSPCAITPRTLVLIAGHATSITKILKCVNKNFKIELREIDSKSGMMLLLDLHYSDILFQRLLSDGSVNRHFPSDEFFYELYTIKWMLNKRFQQTQLAV